jgi:hypothetical protein
MSKRRWMKSLKLAETDPTFPWTRGVRRNRWKAGARARALAA